MRKTLIALAGTSLLFASGAAFADTAATAQPVVMVTQAESDNCHTYIYHEGLLVKSGKCLTSLQRYDGQRQYQEQVLRLQLRALGTRP